MTRISRIGFFLLKPQNRWLHHMNRVGEALTVVSTAVNNEALPSVSNPEFSASPHTWLTDLRIIELKRTHTDHGTCALVITGFSQVHLAGSRRDVEEATGVIPALVAVEHGLIETFQLSQQRGVQDEIADWPRGLRGPLEYPPPGSFARLARQI